MKFDSLSKLVRNCLEQAGGSFEQAHALAVSEIASKENAHLVQKAVEQSVRQTLDSISSSLRAEMWEEDHKAKLAVTDKGVESGALVRMTERNLLEYPLENGLPIGDATQQELKTSIARDFAVSRTLIVRGTWKHLISEGLEPGQTVREVYSHEQLAALQDKAGNVSGFEKAI